jgi:putative DNA primase/helicase
LRDENDKLIDGTLPDDPMADAVPFSLESVTDLGEVRWRQALKKNQDGVITNDPGNATLLLINEADWKGVLAYDEFSDRCYFAQRPPEVPGFPRANIGDRFADHHYLPIGQWLTRWRSRSFPKQTVQDAMVCAAKANTHHPLKDYLNGLEWDGVSRLSNWPAKYLSAEDSEYTRSVGRWWAISAVARALKPGCQVDHMLVLEGAQGRKKSRAVRILGFEERGWYLGSLPSLRDDQKAAERIQGKWIVEVGELDALRGAAATRTKDFLTQTLDSYRPAYGRFSLDRPRTVVFCGTTNEVHYLHDPTGARRFWPLRILETDAERLMRDRDQIWAEAVNEFRNGARWWPSEAEQELLSVEQEARHEIDSWEEIIDRWLGDRANTTITEVLSVCLSIEPGKHDRQSQLRVGACLRRLGWQTHGKARPRRYFPAESKLVA